MTTSYSKGLRGLKKQVDGALARLHWGLADTRHIGVGESGDKQLPRKAHPIGSVSRRWLPGDATEGTKRAKTWQV
jgi:hypothetical protein